MNITFNGVLFISVIGRRETNIAAHNGRIRIAIAIYGRSMEKPDHRECEEAVGRAGQQTNAQSHQFGKRKRDPSYHSEADSHCKC